MWKVSGPEAVGNILLVKTMHFFEMEEEFGLHADSQAFEETEAGPVEERWQGVPSSWRKPARTSSIGANHAFDPMERPIEDVLIEEEQRA
jgi:hypothetical protein